MSYEYITKYTSPNRTAGTNSVKIFGLARRISGIAIHHWGDPATNPSFNGVINWLCRKGGNSSAHYVIEAGRIACIVSPEDVAWHSGTARGNATTIGLELNPRASEADYETAGELIAELWHAYGKIELYKHSDFKATKCPGRWNLYKLEKIAELHYLNKPKKTQPKKEPSSASVWHVIKSGETLSGIALKYGTKVKTLANLNNISNVNKITAGKKIKIK